jgi:hypothetical protein
MFVVTLAVAAYRRVHQHQLRASRLRLLTGTSAQQAVLVRALRPVVREFVPQLEHAGLEVISIALLPALVGSAGEPLQAQVEQVDGTRSFTIRLACSVAGTLRRPEDVAGALADELLDLYHSTARVTVVRQTPIGVHVANPTLSGTVSKPAARGSLASMPRIPPQSEAEETVIPFKASPLGRTNNTQGL